MSRIVENDKNPIDRVVGQTATTPLVLTVADANRIAIESTGNGPAPKLSRFAVERLLARADIRIGGARPWDIRVRDERFYSNVLLRGSLGLGETYLWGWWTCSDLDELFYRLIVGRMERISRALPTHFVGRLVDGIVNQQSRQKALRVAERHYNLGSDLFLAFNCEQL